MRLFISYKSQERDVASTVRDHLHEWGYSTWLDVDDIPAGTTPHTKGWDDAIHEGMKACHIVIGLLSKASVASENVRDEWGWALSNQRRLFLLWIDDVPEEDIPPRYQRIQRLDCRNNVAHGLARLQQALASPAKISPTTDADTSLPAPQPYAPPPAQKLTNRQALLNNVYQNWVVGFLDDALHDTDAFTIELDFAHRGAVLKHTDFGDYQLPDTRGIYRLYQDMNRELLILGEPGRGKTILLLQLARELLAEAQHDDSLPIPVVFNLASWAAKREPLAEWLVRQLRIGYQVPKKVGEELVTSGKLALLLDGLDEVAETYRQDCVAAINAYRDTYHRGTDGHLVVCSRVKEYTALVDKLDVRGAVALEPLTPAVIDEYLQREEVAGLRAALDSDAELKAMSTEPLLLNIMAYVYRKKSAVALQLPEGQDRRAAVYERYVGERLLQGQPAYAPPQARHWLTWLGASMVQQVLSVFYIEDMQPSWVAPLQRRRYYSMARLLGWLLAGIFAVLFLLVGVPYLALVLGGALGASLELNGFMQNRINRIKPVETQRFHITRRSFLRMGSLWVALGMLAAVVGWLIADDVSVLAIGGVGWLLSGLIGALRVGLDTSPDISARSRPNTGMWRSAYHALLLLVIVSVGFAVLSGIVGLVLAIVGLVDTSPAIALGVSAFYGSILGLGGGLSLTFVSGGGPTVIRHTALRLVLWRSGDAPLNYAKFLDDMAARKLVRKVGGGYIFIHRTLMEYFAAQAPHVDGQ